MVLDPSNPQSGMSPSDFTVSMIFVFDRSFAVGFCPSIQMYSAVILAKAAALLLNALRENSTSLAAISGSAAAHDDLILAARFRAIHRGVGAAEELALLVLDRLLIAAGNVLRDADRCRDDAAQIQRGIAES